MTNDNCLANRRCPQCGQQDAISVESLKWVMVHDDGLDCEGDTHYDEDSCAQCPECAFEGQWRDFDIANQSEAASAQSSTIDDAGSTQGHILWPNGQRVTPEEVDRILGVGDQFIEDWEDDKSKDEECNANCAERRHEWDTVRPLLVAAPTLLGLLHEAEEFLLDLTRKGDLSKNILLLLHGMRLAINSAHSPDTSGGNA
jgi:hypothetical protein